MNSKAGKIILIIPYYGSWPNYINFFINSVNKNDIIEVLYITDLELPEFCDEKSHHKIHFSLKELNNHVNEKLDFFVNLESFRKLCDLKPLYGHLFEDHIKDYGYWAFGDLDLIFGDIDNLLPEIISNNDVITFHDTWISGPFTVFKNTSYINSLWKTSKDVEKVFSERSYQSFDECGNIYSELLSGESILTIDRKIDCMLYVFSKEAKENNIKFYKKTRIKESILRDEKVEYKNGKLSFNGEELVHYHFITEKQYLRFKFPNFFKLDNDFYFLHTGVYSFKTPKFLVKLNYIYRIYLNEIYRFFGKLFISLNYRLLNKTVKLKYRINVFK